MSWNPIEWIGIFFGWIMDLIFKAGVKNVGVGIIIFTIVSKIILYPLTLKQSKSQKLQSVLQPEIQAIQAKYKGKENDQNAMMMQQAEIKAVYEKYGTSMTAGCLPLLIQFPIIFGLYKVIINMPQYVSSVRVYFENIFEAIGGSSAIAKVNQFITENGLGQVLTQARIKGGAVATEGDVINFLNKLSGDQWTAFRKFFAEAETTIAANLDTINSMNNFLGIDLASTPRSLGLSNPVAWIIPVLAGLSQYVSSKVMQKQTENAAMQNEQSTQMMSTMNYMLPLMSVVFCFSFASGIGVYWIAQAIVSAVQQYFINKKLEKMDMNALIRANLDKTNAKRAKKGLPPVNEKLAEENYKKMQAQMSRLEAKKNAAAEKTQRLQEESNGYYKTGSIAERAQMVQQYNERKKKK